MHFLGNTMKTGDSEITMTFLREPHQLSPTNYNMEGGDCTT